MFLYFRIAIWITTVAYDPFLAAEYPKIQTEMS